MQSWRGLRRLPPGLWLLLGATLINRAGTMVLPFLALYLTRSRGLTDFQAGLVLAVYGAGALLTAPFAGRLADRYGPRRILELSLFASGTAILLLLAAPGFPTLALAAFLWSVLAEAYRPASVAAVSELVPPEQLRTGISLVRLAVNLGMSFGPALGGFLASISYAALFVVDGGTSLLAGALFLVAGTRLWRSGSRPATAAALPATGDSPWRNRAFLTFLLGVFPISCVFFQFLGAMPLYLVRDLGLSSATYGLLFTLSTLLVVVFEVPLSLTLQKRSHRGSMIVGSLLYGIGFGSLQFVHEVWGAALCVVVLTCGEMTLLSTLSAHTTRYAPANRQGAYIGVYSMVVNLAFTVGPWLGTVGLDRFGPAVWSAAFALAVLSAVVLGMVQEHPRREAAPGAAAAAGA